MRGYTHLTLIHIPTYHCSSSNKLYSNVNHLVDEATPKENPYGYGDESIYACVCPSRHEQV